jgi:DNA-binding transcriptional ArsR family regulator
VATRVQDLTGRELAYQVHVEHGLAYEFLISLCAFGNPEEHPTYEGTQEWFDNVRTSGSSQLLASLERFGPGAGKVWVNLIGLATGPPAVHEVPALLELVAGMDPLDLRLYFLGVHVPAYAQSVGVDVLTRAGDGDTEAQQRLFADRCFFGGEAEKYVGPLLSLTPDGSKDLALEVMERWYHESFRDREAEWEPILRRDAEAKRALLRTMPPAAAIEAASGIQFVPQAGIQHVYLIPQLATRPWVWLAEHDDARLYCYPVADESLGGDASAPPSRLVRLHKALGDEKRLRMLKAIATSGATLQELADRFGLPKSTAHHHLAILRSAGLIRVTSDEEHRYSVRRDVIPELSTLLDSYLGPNRGPDRPSA